MDVGGDEKLLERVGVNKIQNNGGSKTMGDSNNTLGIFNSFWWSWHLSKSDGIFNEFEHYWICFWVVLDTAEILIRFGESLFGIWINLRKSFFWIFEILNHFGAIETTTNLVFEILNNYGTSWEINVLESPLNIPSPTPTTLLGDTSELEQFDMNNESYQSPWRERGGGYSA